jgi:hypothetical protein
MSLEAIAVEAYRTGLFATPRRISKMTFAHTGSSASCPDNDRRRGYSRSPTSHRAAAAYDAEKFLVSSIAEELPENPRFRTHVAEERCDRSSSSDPHIRVEKWTRRRLQRSETSK